MTALLQADHKTKEVAKGKLLEMPFGDRLLTDQVGYHGWIAGWFF